MTDLLPGLAVIAIDQPLAERVRNGYQPERESWPAIIFLFLPREMW